MEREAALLVAAIAVIAKTTRLRVAHAAAKVVMSYPDEAIHISNLYLGTCDNKVNACLLVIAHLGNY